MSSELQTGKVHSANSDNVKCEDNALNASTDMARDAIPVVFSPCEPEWPSIAFANAPFEIIDGDRGTNYPKQHEFSSEGHCLFLNAGNVTSSGFQFIDCAFIDEEKDAVLRKGKLKRGDLVLTTRGTVGNVGYYSNSVQYDHIRINSGMVILRPDSEKILPYYLYLFLRSSLFKEQVKSLTSGSAQPQLPIRDMNRAEFLLPPLYIQKQICEILGALDDRIDLLRETNVTLEAMAQALFKSWFVDFDPVHANAGTRAATLPAELQALFPPTFTDTPQGPVPEGWSISAFGDFIDRKSVGKKFDQKSALPDGLVPILDQGKSGIIGYHNEEPGVKASLENPVVVFANHTCYMRLITYDFSAIQNVLPFVGKGVDTVWAYYATKGRVRFSEYKGHWPDFTIEKCTLPPQRITGLFRGVVDPLIKSMRNNEVQMHTLATLRDTLLPRLISGQLRLPDAEAALAEAGA